MGGTGKIRVIRCFRSIELWGLSRRRSGLVGLDIDFVADLLEAFFERNDPLSQAPTDFREPASKEEQHHRADDEHFEPAKIREKAECERVVHGLIQWFVPLRVNQIPSLGPESVGFHRHR